MITIDLTFLSRYCENICRSSCHGKNPGSSSFSIPIKAQCRYSNNCGKSYLMRASCDDNVTYHKVRDQDGLQIAARLYACHCVMCAMLSDSRFVQIDLVRVTINIVALLIHIFTGHLAVLIVLLSGPGWQANLKLSAAQLVAMERSVVIK